MPKLESQELHTQALQPMARYFKELALLQLAAQSKRNELAELWDARNKVLATPPVKGSRYEGTAEEQRICVVELALLQASLMQRTDLVTRLQSQRALLRAAQSLPQHSGRKPLRHTLHIASTLPPEEAPTAVVDAFERPTVNRNELILPQRNRIAGPSNPLPQLNFEAKAASHAAAAKFRIDTSVDPLEQILTTYRSVTTNLTAAFDNFARHRIERPINAHSFPNLSIPRKGFVFIISCGQTGDIELQHLLNQQIGVLIRGENDGALSQLIGIWEAVRVQWYEYLMSHDDMVEGGQESITLQSLDLMGRQLANAFSAGILSIPKRNDLDYCGFREVRIFNSSVPAERQIAFMKAFFPFSKFILSVRNPEKSFAERWVSRQNRLRMIENMSAAQNHLETTLRTIAGKDAVIVRYEEYMNDSMALRPVFDLLKIPFDFHAVTSFLNEHGTSKWRTQIEYCEPNMDWRFR